MSIWPGRAWSHVLLPTLLVLAWVAVPVPRLKKDKAPSEGVLPDVGFSFFLVWFFGVYVAVGLLWVTSLFNLYVQCSVFVAG